MCPDVSHRRDGRQGSAHRAHVGFEGWPAVRFEETEWAPTIDTAWMSRAERRAQTPTYRAAILPEISHLDPILDAATAALVDEASTEIARFDAEMGGEIAPFAAVLLQSESASSSQIEHLTASARSIALAEIGDTSKRNATEIVANTRAMSAAIDLADRIDAEAILSMHDALMSHTHPDIAGKWRRQPVWIGRGDHSPHYASFVPPRFERVPAAIDDLTCFLDRDDLPVLTQAAVAHAHFETIHPFPDGNGRTGRALVHALLRGKGLTRNITVPISAGLLANTDGYFTALTAYRSGDIGPIARSMAEASLGAITNGRQLVADLRAIRAEWASRVSARSDSAARRILDSLARQPVVDAAYVQRELGISSSATQRALVGLERAGIVVEFSGLRRNRCWRSNEVLAALDNFAARAGRRG